MKYMRNDIKHKVWGAMIEHEGLKEGSRAADRLLSQLGDTTDEAVDLAIMMTAKTILAEVREKLNPSNEITVERTLAVLEMQRIDIETRWVGDICDICNQSKESVVRHKDGKRYCAKCEVLQSLE